MPSISEQTLVRVEKEDERRNEKKKSFHFLTEQNEKEKEKERENEKLTYRANLSKHYLQIPDYSYLKYEN
jgi:hypothetical protein